jgi:hypothetical protein
MLSIGRRSLALGILLVALLPAVSHADAASLPTGHAKGVSVAVRKHTVSFRFGRNTDPTVRHLASGRRVELTCTQLGPMRLERFRPSSTDGDRVRAPRRLRELRLEGLSSPAPSFCSVWQLTPVRRSLVDIPITEDGAAYLDERETFRTISNAATAASFDAEDAGRTTFAPTDELVSDWNNGNLGPAVALLSPGDSPPAGTLGLFSDGALHFAAVKLTGLGHRLFYDINGEVVTTNAQVFGAN